MIEYKNMNKNFINIKQINKEKRFDTNVPLLIGDREGLEFTNYQKAAQQVAKRINLQLGNVTVLELCCGVGATTVFLAKQLSKIIAVDLLPQRIQAAKINAKNFGVENKIEFWQEDVMVEAILMNAQKKNVKAVFIDVEWRSNRDQKTNHHTTDLSKTIPSATVLFEKVKRLVTDNIILHVSPAIDEKQLRKLGKCEIEKCYFQNELKFFNVYYGKFRKKASSKLMM